LRFKIGRECGDFAAERHNLQLFFAYTETGLLGLAAQLRRKLRG
jgi:hypothetical protein